MVNINAIDEIRNYLNPTDSLVCVSKKQNIESIISAYEFGLRDFGENIVSEFANKYEKLPKDIRWHFIGHLQSNKVKYIIGKTFLIHSLDRVSLLNELENYSEKLKVQTNVLIQVNISKEPQKGGVLLENLDEFLHNVEKCNYIKVKGLMSIGSTELEKAKDEFIEMKCKWDEIKKNKHSNIEMQYLSMGMSDDFKIALECGSNMIRIGTYIFGSRNNV